MQFKRLFSRRRKTTITPTAAAKPLAAPPGTLVHVGEKRSDTTRIRRISYNREMVNEEMDWDEPDSSDEVTWIDITGLHDVELISRIGRKFEITTMMLEDILNTAGRPKIEDFDEAVFVVIRMISRKKSGVVDSQAFSLLLLPGNMVITFREAASGVFEPIKNRIRIGKGRIRKVGGDYLAWAILDAVIDHYLDVISLTDEMLTGLEDRLDEDDRSIEIGQLHAAKRDVLQLYREMRPVREITNTLYRTESELVLKDSAPFFRDLHDHSVQAEETIGDLREAAAGLRDYYHTVVSNRMNEVMKVLTCLSTIFLPLTFLAGIYGMNFEVIPELKWEYSYFVFWGATLAIATSLYLFFRRKNWL